MNWWKIIKSFLKKADKPRFKIVPDGKTMKFNVYASTQHGYILVCRRTKSNLVKSGHCIGTDGKPYYNREFDLMSNISTRDLIHSEFEIVLCDTVEYAQTIIDNILLDWDEYQKVIDTNNKVRQEWLAANPVVYVDK